MMHPELQRKKERLERYIASQGSMLVAFSGGVDSTLLAVCARKILGDRAVCVLLESALLSRRAIARASGIARELHLNFEILHVPVMEDAAFVRNQPDRCYRCRKISAVHLKERARELGLSSVADGVNFSDLGEYRPGIAAATEVGIIHPFVQAGMTKEDIRALAREIGLSVWNEPASPCLASRIPYGDALTEEGLRKVEDAEQILSDLGFVQFRVRQHGKLARIEVSDEELGRAIASRALLVERLKKLGFIYVTLDLGGYRSGSMDEALIAENDL
ncbi:MAG: ATP-dependent sacrificial sulfur transferase LarE [Methanomicrobiales archaeon]|nr:ATP-dependent sacrificial sulfur transferase LarE [Methanomicrobiales archaeon]